MSQITKLFLVCSFLAGNAFCPPKIDPSLKSATDALTDDVLLKSMSENYERIEYLYSAMEKNSNSATKDQKARIHKLASDFFQSENAIQDKEKLSSAEREYVKNIITNLDSNIKTVEFPEPERKCCLPSCKTLVCALGLGLCAAAFYNNIISANNGLTMISGNSSANSSAIVNPLDVAACKTHLGQKCFDHLPKVLEALKQTHANCLSQFNPTKVLPIAASAILAKFANFHPTKCSLNIAENAEGNHTEIAKNHAQDCFKSYLESHHDQIISEHQNESKAQHDAICDKQYEQKTSMFNSYSEEASNLFSSVCAKSKIPVFFYDLAKSDNIQADIDRYFETEQSQKEQK